MVYAMFYLVFRLFLLEVEPATASKEEPAAEVGSSGRS